MKIYLLGASISVIKIKYIVVKNITFQCLFKIPFIYGLSIYKLVKKLFMVYRMLLIPKYPNTITFWTFS